MSTEEFLIAASILLALALVFLFGNLIYNKKKLSPPPSTISPTSQEERPAATPPPPLVSWFTRLQNGLSKTHHQMIRSLDTFFLSKEKKVSRDEILEHLFETLITADVGVATSEYLLERLKERLKKEDVLQVQTLITLLKEEILELLVSCEASSPLLMDHLPQTPYVVLMVGVNGVGKTTTTGKLAYKYAQTGVSTIIGAADTFRAAAVEQLSIWADRAQVPLVRLKEGSDPASVAFETVKQAKEKKASLCFIDTAGRLQTRSDLMQELSKISRVIQKEIPQAPHEVLLVLDATTGQNALQQAKIFRDAVAVTGLVLTKLDGSAKGGIVLAIAAELKLPIRYVGVGEGVEDLQPFHAKEFVDALFS